MGIAVLCTESALGMVWGSWWGGHGVLEVAFIGSTGLLWCCVGPTSPVGARVLFWRQVGGEGSAPEPRSPGWEVGMGVLVWLLPALPTAMECLFVA